MEPLVEPPLIVEEVIEEPIIIEKKQRGRKPKPIVPKGSEPGRLASWAEEEIKEAVEPKPRFSNKVYYQEHKDKFKVYYENRKKKLDEKDHYFKQPEYDTARINHQFSIMSEAKPA